LCRLAFRFGLLFGRGLLGFALFFLALLLSGGGIHKSHQIVVNKNLVTRIPLDALLVLEIKLASIGIVRSVDAQTFELEPVANSEADRFRRNTRMQIILMKNLLQGRGVADIVAAIVGGDGFAGENRPVNVVRSHNYYLPPLVELGSLLA